MSWRLEVCSKSVPRPILSDPPCRFPLPLPPCRSPRSSCRISQIPRTVWSFPFSCKRTSPNVFSHDRLIYRLESIIKKKKKIGGKIYSLDWIPSPRGRWSSIWSSPWSAACKRGKFDNRSPCRRSIRKFCPDRRNCQRYSPGSTWRCREVPSPRSCSEREEKKIDRLRFSRSEKEEKKKRKRKRDNEPWTGGSASSTWAVEEKSKRWRGGGRGAGLDKFAGSWFRLGGLCISN